MASSKEAQHKAAKIFIGFLVAYVVLRGLRAATFRPLWFDEIYTLTIANHATLRGVWDAIRAGYDSQAPGFGVLEHFALLLPIKKEVALRLPSIAAFVVVLLCIFSYLRRRAGDLIASVCALLLLSTSLFHTYLIEARSYGSVFACIAFALVCYDRVPSPRWTLLFAASLMLAESFHYYAVFAMIPFWFAEAVQSLKEKRFRWNVWLALVFGTLPLLASLRLLLALRALYGPNVWARPVLSAVRGFYPAFFLLTDNAIGLAMAAVAIVSIAWARIWPGLSTDSESRKRSAGLSEAILLLSFVALPGIVFILVRVLHGILIARYVLTATIGIVAGLAYALKIGGRRAASIFAIFVFTVVVVRESIFWRTPEFDPFLPYYSATSLDQLRKMQVLIESSGHNDLPVVVSDGLIYTQLVYYADPHWTEKLVYLVDAPRERRSVGVDTASRIMLSFSHYFPLQTLDYSKFVGAHRQFLLFADGADWYWSVLLDDGATIEPVSRQGPLYLVKMKSENSSQ